MVSPAFRQVWTVIGVFLSFLSHGTVLSYSSCLIPGLRAGDSTIKVDLDSSSWLVSGVGITMTMSGLLIPVLMDRHGRRWTHALVTSFVAAGWLFIYWAQGFKTLMIGRLVGGFGITGSFVCGCCVLSEYVSPEFRGLTLNFKTFTLFFGYLYMHVVGHFLDWRSVALLSLVPCVLSLLNNLAWLESPSWLLAKNRLEEFEDTFYLLRGRSEKAVRELESMIRAQKSRMSKTAKPFTFSQKVVNLLKKFRQKNFLLPLLTVFFGTILIETTGRHFFAAYAVDVMVDITKDKSNTFYYIIGIDVMALASTAISCILVKAMGIKKTLFFSGISSAILLSILALISFLTSEGSVSIDSLWLVPSLAGLFYIFGNLGSNSIPVVIYAEIFPLQHRESGVAFGGAIQSLFIYIFLKVTPYSFLYLKLHGTFAWLALMMIISLVFLYFALPETMNRTMQEIEDYLEHGKYIDDADGDDRRDEEAEEMMLTQAGRR